jgi:hypothetical protein
MKRTLILSIALSLAWQISSLVLASGPGLESRAAELMAKARQSIGGDAKLKAIKSLSISAKYRRVMGDRDSSGDTEFELLLPDKIRRSETMNLIAGIEMTRIDVINGNTVWSDAQTNGAHGGGTVVVRRPAETPEAKAGAELATRADLSRAYLTFLLSSPASTPLEYTYVGEAEAPDGKAEVVDVIGPNNFNLRLFLDQKTGRPLMMSYKGRAPRYSMRTITGDQGSPEEIRKKADEEAAKMAAVPDVEFQLTLDNYRSVDGVLFPHTLTRMVDGKTTEETEIRKIVINPQIKPDRFDKK